MRRGIWKPPQPEPKLTPAGEQDPPFHEFASTWFEATKGEWTENTRLDYQWQLSHHLLPFFKDHHLSQITIAEVDRYRAQKVRESARLTEALAAWRKRAEAAKNTAERRELAGERPPRALSAVSINKTITRLGQILEVAVEYGLIDRNPARGKRRRLKASKPAPVWLDSAEQIEALLDAASELDRHAKVKGGNDQKGGLVYRRALLATFVFAGLRIGELTALTWRDVDLAGNRISVCESKTDAGTRQIDLLPALRDELAAYKAQAPDTRPTSFVFPSAAGTKLAQENIRSRVLEKTIERTNEKLIEADGVPLPEGLTPHKLRHTYASILVALGVDPGSVMDQLGHADPGFTLRVYRHGMRRGADARERLRALVGGSQWTPLPSSETPTPWSQLAASPPHALSSPR
ncbi:MAG TPA: tyrosine-type recombinase/integrase [Polyangiaceae bacterium]